MDGLFLHVTKSFAAEQENWLEFRGCFSLHIFWKIAVGFDVMSGYSQGSLKKIYYALLYFSLPILMVLCDVCPPLYMGTAPPFSLQLTDILSV